MTRRNAERRRPTGLEDPAPTKIMLTDKLKSQVDALWDKLWTGGLSNPLDAIEQFSYLLFMKRLDEQEDANEKRARRVGAGSSRP
jgi:type I restriction enzyme M protein